MGTLREWRLQGTARLSCGPHADRAKQDAELILRFLLGKDQAWMMANLDSEVLPEWDRFYELLQRRYYGEPIQYITGQAEFFGLPFHVTPAVLIPRPETEHLVEKVLRLAKQFPTARIADIGTGSGAIAIALARTLPNAQITATDLSPAALNIAKQNARSNQVEDRIAFLEGNLLAPLSSQQFEIIASNPPYIPTTDQPTLSGEVRDHEPHSALFAGPDGLEIYQRLIPVACQHLTSNGWLVLEIGYGQQAAIEALFKACGYQDIHFIPDYQGIPRVAVARQT